MQATGVWQASPKEAQTEPESPDDDDGNEVKEAGSPVVAPAAAAAEAPSMHSALHHDADAALPAQPAAAALTVDRPLASEQKEALDPGFVASSGVSLTASHRRAAQLSIDVAGLRSLRANGGDAFLHILSESQV